jgi:hypothetical protein
MSELTPEQNRALASARRAQGQEERVNARARAEAILAAEEHLVERSGALLRCKVAVEWSPTCPGTRPRAAASHSAIDPVKDAVDRR